MRRACPAIACWAWCGLASQPAKGDDRLQQAERAMPLFLVVVPRVNETPAGHMISRQHLTAATELRDNSTIAIGPNAVGTSQQADKRRK
jgi:hypothetical protein